MYYYYIILAGNKKKCHNITLYLDALLPTNVDFGRRRPKEDESIGKTNGRCSSKGIME